MVGASGSLLVGYAFPIGRVTTREKNDQGTAGIGGAGNLVGSHSPSNLGKIQNWNVKESLSKSWKSQQAPLVPTLPRGNAYSLLPAKTQ